MRTAQWSSLLVTAAAMVSAQDMVPTSGSSTFPACAVGCTVLMNAQTTCTPPNSVTSTQLFYDSCFCQVPTLDDLYTTGETLCTSQCTTTSDRQLLSTWYAGFCKSVAAGVDPVYGSSAQTGTQTTLSTSTTATASSTGSTTSATKAASTYVVGLASDDTRPWIQSHWQYIVMLLFLFFGLLGLGLGARWLKHRHDIKLKQRRLHMLDLPVAEGKDTDQDRSPSPDVVEKHQDAIISKDFQHTSGKTLPVIAEDQNSSNNSKESSKRVSRIEVTEIKPVLPPMNFEATDQKSP